MTTLYYADTLKGIAEKHISEEAKGLLDIIATSAMEQAKRGSYSFAISTGHMEEIRGILERKGYKIGSFGTDNYEISWY